MRRTAALFLIFLTPALLLSACVLSPAQPHSRTTFAMDTVMDLTVYGNEEILDDSVKYILLMDSLLSTTAGGSEITALNENGTAQVSGDTAALLGRALELCKATDGALDITVYPAVRAWGFTTGEYRVPDSGELSALSALVDYSTVTVEDSTVTLPEGVMVDLGAVAKGWLSDELAASWRQAGVKSALMNLGGNVYALGSKPDGSPWRIGIRDPFSEETAGAVSVTDRAVVTSGGYQRYFEEDGVRYHHILDPRTCSPARSGLASVTVICREGVVADAFSTAIFVMGPDWAAERWREDPDMDLVLITDGGEVYITEGIQDSFSLLGSYTDKEAQVLYRD